jgi:hypothetical protein
MLTFQQLEASAADVPPVVKRELTCIATGRDDVGLWEAICLDLDIAVAGSSFDEVKNSLRSAIETYFEDARREAEPTRSQLLSRRVPFWARLRWTWPFLLAVQFGRKQQGAQATCEFPLTCPV